MRLILHDLDQNQVEAAGLNTFSTEQNIIIDSRGIRQYCLGCFACWLKTPGKCIIPDEYQTMGENLSKVDEFLIISKSTLGSYSSSVKNVLDRSISYVLPYFEVRKGEMHHQERYHKNLEFSAVFYGDDITENEKETARNLVEANALNLNGTSGKVHFAPSMAEVKEAIL